MLCFLLYHVVNGGNKLFVFVFVFVLSSRLTKKENVLKHYYQITVFKAILPYFCFFGLLQKAL
jgi:hypothetical protein